MATDIVMPQLGESIAEGTVVRWLIPQGGSVEKDQPLLEVETEKVALDIPSPATGFLTEILVPAGETVPVGKLLARLDNQPATGVVSRVGGVGVRPMEAAPEGEHHYSPAVRQLAHEHGVNLSALTGTGEGGRVTKKDVLDYVAKGAASGTTPQRSDMAPVSSPSPLCASGRDDSVYSDAEDDRRAHGSQPPHRSPCGDIF